MALAMMGMLPMLEVKLEQLQDISRLLVANYITLLAHYLPSRNLDED